MKILGREMKSIWDGIFCGNRKRNEMLRDEIRSMIAYGSLPKDSPEWIRIDTGISVNSKNGEVRSYWGMPGF